MAVTEPLSEDEAATVAWLLRETYEPDSCTAESQLPASATSSGDAHGDSAATIIEVGPRLTFSTAWSANAVSACAGCGISKVTRLERSRRYAVEARGGALSAAECATFAALVHDRMTEEVYERPLRSFEVRVPERFGGAPSCRSKPCLRHAAQLVVAHRASIHDAITIDPTPSRRARHSEQAISAAGNNRCRRFECRLNVKVVRRRTRWQSRRGRWR